MVITQSPVLKAASSRKSAWREGSRSRPSCGPGGFWSGSRPSRTSKVRRCATSFANLSPFSHAVRAVEREQQRIGALHRVGDQRAERLNLKAWPEQPQASTTAPRAVDQPVRIRRHRPRMPLAVGDPPRHARHLPFQPVDDPTLLGGVGRPPRRRAASQPSAAGVKRDLVAHPRNRVPVDADRAGVPGHWATPGRSTSGLVRSEEGDLRDRRRQRAPLFPAPRQQARPDQGGRPEGDHHPLGLERYVGRSDSDNGRARRPRSPFASPGGEQADAGVLGRASRSARIPASAITCPPRDGTGRRRRRRLSSGISSCSWASGASLDRPATGC